MGKPENAELRFQIRVHGGEYDGWYVSSRLVVYQGTPYGYHALSIRPDADDTCEWLARRVTSSCYFQLWTGDGKYPLVNVGSREYGFRCGPIDTIDDALLDPETRTAIEKSVIDPPGFTSFTKLGKQFGVFGEHYWVDENPPLFLSGFSCPMWALREKITSPSIPFVPGVVLAFLKNRLFDQQHATEFSVVSVS